MVLRIPTLWLVTAAASAAACLTFAIAFYPRGQTEEEKYAFAAQRKKAFDTIAQGLGPHAAGNVDEAVAKYREAIAIDPAVGSAYYLIGTKLLGEDKLDEAIKEFDQALLLDKNPEHIYNNRGVARMRRGDLDGALTDFNAALAIRPSIKQSRANRGFIRLQQKDFAAAAQDFDAVIAQFRGPAEGVEVYVGRGIARAGLGDLTGAEADFSAARDWATGKPRVLKVLVNRAILRERAGDAAGAQADRAEMERLSHLPDKSKEFERPLKGADEQPIGRDSQQ